MAGWDARTEEEIAGQSLLEGGRVIVLVMAAYDENAGQRPAPAERGAGRGGAR